MLCARAVSARLFLGAIVAVVVALRLLLAAMKRRRRRPGPPGGIECPACRARRLVVTAAIALPGPPAFDLEALACRRCTFRGAGVRTPDAAEESERHVGYPMAPLAWGSFSAAILRCPAPRDPACSCDEHRRLGERGVTEGVTERFEIA